jgi:hypothetical protein
MSTSVARQIEQLQDAVLKLSHDRLAIAAERLDRSVQRLDVELRQLVMFSHFRLIQPFAGSQDAEVVA